MTRGERAVVAPALTARAASRRAPCDRPYRLTRNRGRPARSPTPGDPLLVADMYRRRARRPVCGSATRGLLLAQPRPRPVRCQGHDGRRSDARRARAVRPRAGALADIDGSCTTDLVYLHRDGVRVVLKTAPATAGTSRSRWTSPPSTTSRTSTVLDLLGDGTAAPGLDVAACPVPRAGACATSRLLRGKPHLLTALCATTWQRHETRQQRRADHTLRGRRPFGRRPWLTRLPFPGHVVEQCPRPRPGRAATHLHHDLPLPTTGASTHRARARGLRHGGDDRGPTTATTRRTRGRGGRRRSPRTWHHCGDSPLPPTWPSGKGLGRRPGGDWCARTRRPRLAGPARSEPLRTEVYAVADDGSVDVPYQVTQARAHRP